MEFTLKVPVDPLLKDLECPVCFEHLTQPMLTKCGHTFCKDCLEECINRRHECPHCKSPLELSEAIRNYQVETLLSKL